MTALDRGEAYGWETTKIDHPREFSRERAQRVSKLEVLPEGHVMDRLREGLQGIKGSADNFTARCPGHDDHANSLQVKRLDNGKISVQCFAKCELNQILDPLGMKPRDLYPDEQPAPKAPKQIERTYDYVDAHGRLLYQVVRYVPKDFRPRRPDGRGGWIWNLSGVDRVLYRLPQVLKAKAEEQTIFFCEGEKDVDNLAALGLCATTAGNATGWRDTFETILQGTDLIVLEDNDDAGRKCAATVASKIIDATILRLPGLPPKGDVSDWIAQGGTVEALQALVAQARANPVEDAVEAPTPEPEAKARALPAFTDLSDAFELALTPLPHLFYDAMPLGEVAAFGSEPGVGKTFVAIILGLSVSFFQTMMSGFVPCRPGRVLLLLGEDMKHACALRIEACCRRHGISEEQYRAACADERIMFICGESAELLTFEGNVCRRTKAFHELKAQCEIHKWDLIVVDSLMQWSGLSEENANTQMHAIGAALVELARTTGGVVLPLCHTTKADNRAGKASLSAFRGGGAFTGKIRWGAILLPFSDADIKYFGIEKDCQKQYLKLECVKSQYGAPFNEPITLERGPGGVLDVVKLAAPKSEDALLVLARVLADKIGANEMNMAKWSILTGKPGAEIRRQLKAEHGKNATQRTLTSAYDVAVEQGWLIEDNDDSDGGDNAKIPRIPAAEVVECLY